MNFEKENLPKHIAIIMDGNRRWAKVKGKPSGFGHKEGAKVLEKIVRYANKIGIEHITVYAFSTENWKRAEEEVSTLMALFQSYLDDYSKRADSENIKVKIIGNIALNYGGREELLNVTHKIAEDVKNGNLQPEEITEKDIEKYLYTAGQPDPDLLIRTSGEKRLSNFLPWQLSYSEFLFIDKNWPDFTEEDLNQAIEEYQKRTRKFGAN